MTSIRNVVVFSIFSLFFAGCAVKPIPLTKEEQVDLVRSDLNAMFAELQQIDKPISLPEAMARAIKYNLDYRVQLMEEALRRGELEVARNGLLPELTAAAGYNDRNNQPGSSSISAETGEESLEPSISQEKQTNTRNLTLTWNLLDFGVSLAQAKQQANQILISQEKKRKVVQNIIQDVRYAYWRAVSADRLLPEMNSIIANAEDSFQAVDVLQQFSIQDPLIYLEYKKELLNLILEMWQIREDLTTAKAEFAALINLPPGQKFTLVDYRENLPLPDLNVKIESLEGYALAHRPDIRQEHYQARISAEEIKKSMLRMLPGLEISVGSNYDSNKFLINSDWNQLGLRISWNIFNLFTAQDAIDTAKAQHELDNARRLSLSMAVLTQVHLAVRRFQVAKKIFIISRDLNQVEQSMLKQVFASQQAEMQNEMDVLRTRVSALLATMTKDISYAELQNAYGRILASIGVDPLPDTIESAEIDTIAEAIQSHQENWQEKLL